MKTASTNRLIAAILVVGALAVAFFALALSPKRQEASSLSAEAAQLRTSLAESRSKADEAAVARRDFPVDYRQLVVLGQAVPPSDETSSLLVQLNRVADHSKVTFDSIQLEAGASEAAPEVAPAPTEAEAAPATSAPGAVPAAASVPPTEAAASLLPLGASIGPAGLDVMPYDLSFSGDFFHIADFIKGIDSLVHTNRAMTIDGRLVTLNGFALNADPELGFPHLDATFSVTTYLTPPSQGLTAGATPSAPAPSTATPASTTPEAESTEPTTVAETR